MASHRKMHLEIIDYRRFIGGDSVFYPQCSWEEVLLDFTVSQTFLELVLQGANFCLNKLAVAFG